MSQTISIRFRQRHGSDALSCSHRVKTGSGAHPASAVSLDVTRPGREADHLFLTVASPVYCAISTFRRNLNSEWEKYCVEVYTEIPPRRYEDVLGNGGTAPYTLRLVFRMCWIQIFAGLLATLRRFIVFLSVSRLTPEW